MAKEFILTVTKHRRFGNILAGFIITKSSGNYFYSSIERVNSVNIKDIDTLTDKKTAIVKQLLECDDMYISKLFVKKTEEAKDFIKNVDYEFVEKRVRPHIERRIINIVRLLRDTDVKIYFKDRKNSKIYEPDIIESDGISAKAIFHFERNEEGIQYFLSIKKKDKEVTLKNKKFIILANSPGIVVVDRVLYYFRDIDSKKLQPFFDKEFVSIPKQTEKVYFEKFILNTIKNFEVKAKGFEIIEDHSKPKTILYLQNDLKGEPVLLMKFVYGQQIILPNNRGECFVSLEEKNGEYKFFKLVRHKIYEEIIRKELSEINLTSVDDVNFYPQIEKTDKDNLFFETINWINQNSEKLNKAGIEIRQDFFDRKYYLAKTSIEISVDDTNDWFDINTKVWLGDYQIPFVRLRNNILNNIREYELPNRTIAILPLEWFVRFKELFLFAEPYHNSLRLSKVHFNLLNSKTVDLKSDYAERIKKLFAESSDGKCALPLDLKAELRPYQLAGFKWMEKLQKNEFGGCLADDMGLGKTLQTLTLLLKLSSNVLDAKESEKTDEPQQLNLFDLGGQKANKQKKTKPVSLIVMPASLIYNWYNEIAKFTPSLKAFRHTGNNRTKSISTFSNYDIILTTYGVVRNDYETLRNFPFYYIILDESQVIKNPESKIYKSVIQLQAKCRMVLTGTPIENSLTDLWSQINFVNRGLLGTYGTFKKEFVSPIERKSDEHKSDKLQSLIHPFILRRTKEQVAKDLPLLTEQIQYCDMSDEQYKIYEKEKSAVRNSILEKMVQDNGKMSSVIVLDAITRLRQLANHPKMVGSDAESGKFDEVTRHLDSVIGEGHKVLVFSSFVKHLVIYEDYLKENNKKYAKLTGETTNREAVISQFQNDAETQVFLISLKAGGVGLNLTAADYVFLLDPWWNPAAESQAINRAHRIGQDKNVFVYRFISQGSIEEKIVSLQTQKSELANLFINTNNPFKALTQEKIQQLFD